MSLSIALETIIVTADRMRQIENRLFEAGMPVAALMERAAVAIATRIQSHYPLAQFPRVGAIVGCGHNGGDALVVARELHLAGYAVQVYCPLPKLKELTASHARYAQYLEIPFVENLEALQETDLLIDGLFGFGLTRSLTGELATLVETVNSWQQAIASIDLPSGLHTDTGAVLGSAVRASRSYCLGLWKRCYFQEAALAYVGQVERVDFGIPQSAIAEVLAQEPTTLAMTRALAASCLPLPRPLVTHKYQQGHLLLICGSQRYGGGAILAGLGARASGVGMLSIAAPVSLKPLLLAQLPDALIIGCPETETGAIAQLPSEAGDFERYSAIACGPGLTTDAQRVVEQVLAAPRLLVLDADGLNSLAVLGAVAELAQRSCPTVLTPHWGEFNRLFPDLTGSDRLSVVQQAAKESGAIVLLKGARTAIAHPSGDLRVIAESTPALARGGSGDVLTGLIGGLLAQEGAGNLLDKVATAAYWHAQAGILAVSDRTELGVDAYTLTSYLNPTLKGLVEAID
jgi:hydroxyethylthiazole kinase-like uncharacterized protein yjeF